MKGKTIEAKTFFLLELLQEEFSPQHEEASVCFSVICEDVFTLASGAECQFLHGCSGRFFRPTAEDQNFTLK